MHQRELAPAACLTRSAATATPQPRPPSPAFVPSHLEHQRAPVVSIPRRIAPHCRHPDVVPLCRQLRVGCHLAELSQDRIRLRCGGGGAGTRQKRTADGWDSKPGREGGAEGREQRGEPVCRVAPVQLHAGDAGGSHAATKQQQPGESPPHPKHTTRCARCTAPLAHTPTCCSTASSHS